jgi:hypothetical protein
MRTPIILVAMRLSQTSWDFKAAMDFRLGDNNTAAESIQLGAAPMVTQPMNGQHINDSTPTIKANLATLREVDANSVEMRVSGVGLVPANYEPKSKVVTNASTVKLLPKQTPQAR